MHSVCAHVRGNRTQIVYLLTYNSFLSGTPANKTQLITQLLLKYKWHISALGVLKRNEYIPNTFSDLLPITVKLILE